VISLGPRNGDPLAADYGDLDETRARISRRSARESGDTPRVNSEQISISWIGVDMREKGAKGEERRGAPFTRASARNAIFEGPNARTSRARARCISVRIDLDKDYAF